MQMNEDTALDGVMKAAQRARLVSGKWMLDVPANEAPRAWESVATATRDRRLGCTAKIAKEARGEPPKRLICVYADDCFRRDECARLLDAGATKPRANDDVQRAPSIAGMGLLRYLRRGGFKPDVFTCLADTAAFRWRIHQDVECEVLREHGMLADLPRGRGKKQCRFGQNCRNGEACWFDHD